MTPVRVAHLVSHPIQYFAPLYRELARRPEIDLTVFFYSDASAASHYDSGFGTTVAWQEDILDGYRWRVCRSARGADHERGAFRPHIDVAAAVARGRYDVVWVHGYSHLATWLAAAAARATGARLLVREEQTLLHPRPWHKRVAKSVLLRSLLHGASGLYIGEQNRRYFEHYGVPPERLFFTPYCVDNDRLRGRAAALLPRREQLRDRLGVAGDEPVILFSGKLQEKKRPLVLLEAFRRVRERVPCKLLVVGDGALRSAIESSGVRDVVLAGFLDQDRLPEAYAAADVFALLSAFNETWGLVVNEALNFGLPVVVADKVGCAADLVRAGRNGFVVPADDAGAAAVALERLVAEPGLRRAYGDAGRELVERYSVDACADGIVSACTGVVRRTSAAPQGAAA